MRTLSRTIISISIIVGICSVISLYLTQQDILSLTAATTTTITTSFNSIIAKVLPATNNNNTNINTLATSVSPSPTTNMTAANTTKLLPRLIRQAFLAVEQSEGAGARVRRSIGTPKLRNFSPFLMLDHFSVSPGAGFPDHPHRGQETITYLLQGGMEHEDFAGNKGLLGPGDLQFMTAGRGIVHAEMPLQNKDGSANVGLQLWVDLPKHLKGCEPRYRDLKAEEVPVVEVDGGKVTVKVISGQSHGVDSVKDLAYTPVWLLDVEVRPGGKIVQPLPEGWNAFAYVLEGEVLIGEEGQQRTVQEFHNVVFGQEGQAVYLEVDAGAEKSARLVLVAGTPLDQKVVQYGPFVLTSQEEVYQAFMDYQTHSNGFERADGWESEIGKKMVH
ncbi:RmlC-like cupin domain-containing protein [Staphylotrichum tortipilum]|uniref:RmlC-like cupin domain-containing protein n=1 Tax=Staphylotrichum tortipilum TaxID=2831512 RepID=A0AAN6MEY9_9PEZI|nr:RmlC-like cupin domain-containing protein [Staphylotrichum longicolle]